MKKLKSGMCGKTIDAGELAIEVQKWFDQNDYPRRGEHMSCLVLQQIMQRMLREQEQQEAGGPEETVAWTQRRLTGIYSHVVAMMELCDGSIGAMVFLRELEIQKLKDFYKYLRALDDAGIYDDDLYTLWSTCCGRDTKKAAKLIEDYINGVILDDELHDLINQNKRMG